MGSYDSDGKTLPFSNKFFLFTYHLLYHLFSLWYKLCIFSPQQFLNLTCPWPGRRGSPILSEGFRCGQETCGSDHFSALSWRKHSSLSFNPYNVGYSLYQTAKTSSGWVKSIGLIKHYKELRSPWSQSTILSCVWWIKAMACFMTEVMTCNWITHYITFLGCIWAQGVCEMNSFVEISDRLVY